MTIRHKVAGVFLALMVFVAACDPDGNLDNAVSATGLVEQLRVQGWAWDPGAPGTPVMVSVVVDGVTRATATANRSRPDVAAAIPDACSRVGYDVTVAAAAGSRRVCVIAHNVPGTDGKNVQLGDCKTVSVARSRAPRIHDFGVSAATGPLPHTFGIYWDIETPVTNWPTCRINWDGGAYDETVGNCDDMFLKSHTTHKWGKQTVTLEVSDGVHPPVTASLTVTTTSKWEEPFDITRRYTGVTAAQQAAMEDGIDRWEAVIPVGVPSAEVAVDDEEFCEPASPAVAETIDDVIVDISVEAIDGPGGILAGAGPCLVRGNTGIPAYGTFVIDSADIEDARLAGLLDDIAAHEVGHVLGIGTATVWDFSTLGIGTSDPRYFGNFAWSQSTDPNGIAVENLGGLGSAGSHWRESRYGNELMTSEIDGVNTLSSITIGVLADIGYRVDFDQAEAHPGTTLRDSFDEDHDHDHDHDHGPSEILFTDKRREV